MKLVRRWQSLAKAVYQRTVPHGVRNRLWAARRLGCEALLHRVTRNCRSFFGGTLAVVRLPHVRIYVDMRDQGVGQKIYDFHEYEPTESAVIRRYLPRGGCMIDVGANIGYFTLLAAKLVGPSGQVIAIEPEEYNFGLLSRNVRINRLTSVATLNVALGAEPGQATIFKSAENFGDHRVGIPTASGERHGQVVRIERLDTIVRANKIRMIDFLKIDVQGYEHHVFRGMSSILYDCPPSAVLTEFWPHGIREAGGDPDDYLRLFAVAGYRAFTLDQSGNENEIPISGLMSRVPPFNPAEPDGSFLNVLFRRI